MGCGSPGGVPQGVATRFLGIVAADVQSARSRFIAAAVLSVLLFVPAALLAPVWPGPVVHAVLLAGGFALGLWLASRQSRTYEASMRHTWTQWMRFSVSGESIAEIHRKVRGQSHRNQAVLYAAVLTLIWGAEALLLVLAFLYQAKPELALPFVAATALLAGGITGYAFAMHKWFKQLSGSVDELLASGEVGIWGVV